MNETIKDTNKVSKVKQQTEVVNEYKYLFAFSRNLNKEEYIVKEILNNEFLTERSIDFYESELKERNTDLGIKIWFEDHPKYKEANMWEFLIEKYVFYTFYNKEDFWFHSNNFYKYLYIKLKESECNYIETPLELLKYFSKNDNFNYLFENKK